MIEFCPNCGSMMDSANGTCSICGYSNNVTLPYEVAAAPSAEPAPTQPDIDATTRVNPVPVGPEFDAASYVNPAPAQPDIEATTRVNRAPTPNHNIQAENSQAVPVYTPVQTPDLYEQLNTPEPQKNKPAKKAAKEKTGDSVAATVLLSVSLFIFLLLAVALGSVRVFGSQNVMTKTMGNVKFSELADFADDNNIIVFKAGDGELLSFSEVFYENLQKGIQSHTDVVVSQKQLKKVMDKSTFTTFLGEKIAAYFSDIIDDTKDFELDEDEVSDVVADNFDLFEKEFDISLSRSQEKEVCDQLAEIIVEEDMVEAISPENIKDNNKELVNSVQIVFSWLILILLIVISLFLLVVMIRNDLAQAGLGAGIVCTIIGGIGTLGGVLAVCVPAVWEIIAGAFVGTMISGYFAGNLPVFGGVLAVGVAGFVTKAIAGKRKV